MLPVFHSIVSLFSKNKKKSPPLESRSELRIAIYHKKGTPPEIEVVSAQNLYELINDAANRIYEAVKGLGGKVPYISIREIIENLLHADFQEVVVSVLDKGNTVKISDQGKGIPDKEKVFEHGFSTATARMRHLIKGVGSGLPTAREAIETLGGNVHIEDNLTRGTVVTLSVKNTVDRPAPKEDACLAKALECLNERQKKILSLLSPSKGVGPSHVAQSLGIGLSTSYRELVCLEKQGLISSNEQGKRILTPAGSDLLHHLS